MKRTIPYYERVIRPGSVDQGKNVLIASSKNAIRGLLMHLCEIPEDRIHEVEIPTGVPLVYDVRTKRIRLLDDGLYGNGDPAERYNFGSSVDLLFSPCNVEYSVECFFGENGRSYAYDPVIRLPQAKLADLVAKSPKKTLVEESSTVVKPKEQSLT